MRFLIANWKMNGCLELTDEFIRTVSQVKTQSKVIICPPFPLLFKFSKFSSFYLGAQNCSYKKDGPLTGEVSPLLLKELGCTHVIIGHSERRNLFKETDEEIYQKLKLLCEVGITPILCVGEKIDEKQQWEKIVLSQLEKVKKDTAISQTIIAYEPIWSIGSGKTPTLEEIDERIKFIKHEISSSSHYVVYGGSVNAKNSKEILSMPSVDGVLVGGASLKPEEFLKIVESTN